MKKVCIVGHFGLNRELLNGQTIKTKIIANELERQFGSEMVVRLDTHGGVKRLPVVLFNMFICLFSCKNTIIMPAENGVRVFVPICALLNVIFHHNVHYVVVGGWIDEFVEKHRYLKNALERFAGIYVETCSMKKKLEARGLNNVYVIPNFKNIGILDEHQLVFNDSEPYRFCTFSRVMKEKGIGEAVEAIKNVNRQYGRTVACLDIYGQIEEKQKDWFDELRKSFSDSVRYIGLVSYNDTVETIKNYYALLFPTYYRGEGFAGTLIDAMSSGVPVIASDWKYNNEVVVQGKTGVLIKANDQEALNNAVMSCLCSEWNDMKIKCLIEAKKYQPEVAIRPLVEHL